MKKMTIDEIFEVVFAIAWRVATYVIRIATIAMGIGLGSLCMAFAIAEINARDQLQDIMWAAMLYFVAYLVMRYEYDRIKEFNIKEWIKY